MRTSNFNDIIQNLIIFDDLTLSKSYKYSNIYKSEYIANFLTKSQIMIKYLNKVIMNTYCIVVYDIYNQIIIFHEHFILLTINKFEISVKGKITKKDTIKSYSIYPIFVIMENKQFDIFISFFK